MLLCHTSKAGLMVSSTLCSQFMKSYLTVCAENFRNTVLIRFTMCHNTTDITTLGLELFTRVSVRVAVLLEAPEKSATHQVEASTSVICGHAPLSDVQYRRSDLQRGCWTLVMVVFISTCHAFLLSYLSFLLAHLSFFALEQVWPLEPWQQSVL